MRPRSFAPVFADTGVGGVLTLGGDQAGQIPGAERTIVLFERSFDGHEEPPKIIGVHRLLEPCARLIDGVSRFAQGPSPV